MAKKLLAGVGVIALGVVAYLLFWPVPIDAAAWTPPPAPVVSANHELASGTLRCTSCVGSEDVAVGSNGTIYLALQDGRVVRLGAGDEPEVLAQTKGHPLGTHFDAARNRLVVCDAVQGLLSLDLSTNELTTLTTGHGDRPFRFTDDADVGADGKIYFSDASSKFGQRQYREDIFEHQPNGRLLVYDTETGQTDLLLDELYFANGVALAEDESFVLVNETGKYRTQKLWLDGPKKGTHEVLIDNLPGFPDGISRGSDGVFWIALFAPRNELFDQLLPKPRVRQMIYRLPQALQPKPAPHGYVLGIDADGNVVHDLQDASAQAFSPVTSVQEHDGTLYLGSLTAAGFVEITRPRSETSAP